MVLKGFENRKDIYDRYVKRFGKDYCDTLLIEKTTSFITTYLKYKNKKCFRGQFVTSFADLLTVLELTLVSNNLGAREVAYEVNLNAEDMSQQSGMKRITEFMEVE